MEIIATNLTRVVFLPMLFILHDMLHSAVALSHQYSRPRQRAISSNRQGKGYIREVTTYVWSQHVRLLFTV